ncbi:MAG: DUF2277 domain-containing protein [Actinobacteria bacterium]|jgi:hypothetical protein|nr:DUF2277 domain-containing protein [Actinomycetota bacterium]MDQ3218294.1 DUF2277 domain-containing protein [Actinomycetota bacterium]
MCRSIHKLRDYSVPASNEEIDAAALQFVRKVSGFSRPSRVNEEAFNRGVSEISDATQRLLDSLRPSVGEKVG